MEVSPQVRDLVVDIPVVAQMQISWVFSMSSRSLVGVSIGSCAILSEILESWVTFAWRLTLSLLRISSWARVQNC